MTPRKQPADHQERRGWHVSRDINLALIFMLIAQILTGVWTASKMDSRITVLEDSQKKRDDKMDSILTSIQDLAGRQIRMETRLEFAIPNTMPVAPIGSQIDGNLRAVQLQKDNTDGLPD